MLGHPQRVWSLWLELASLQIPNRAARIGCASRAGEKQRSRWWEADAAPWARTSGTRLSPGTCSKGHSARMAHEHGMPHRRGTSLPAPWWCLAGWVQRWQSRATVHPPVQPSPVEMLLAKPRRDNSSFFFYFQTQNFISVSTGRWNKAFPWGGFYCFLLLINELHTVGSASPARDADVAIFTVSFCASPCISNSKSLF